MDDQYPLPQIPLKKRLRRGLPFYLIVAFLVAAILLPLSGITLFLYYSTHLPDFRPLKEQDPNAHSIVYSAEDEIIAKFLMENRIPIPYDEIPKPLVLAFIAAEDADFFHHGGIDLKGIARAMVKNLMAGRIVQGGSTITQQVTKTFFLTPKKSLLRKLKEVAYAFGLERSLSKEEILYLYLNNIYLGNGAYGVAAAAESYFSKRIEQVNLAEMAMLAGLVKAPSRYSPINNWKRAKERQGYVLKRMAEVGFISEEEKEKALQATLKIQSRESAYFSKAPYFTEFIRQQIEKKYGKEALYQEGLRIYTTLNLGLQRAAQEAIESGLRELDKRQGFRGPIRILSPEEVMNIRSKKGPLGSLKRNETYEAVVLSKDGQKRLFTVWVEDRIGTLPFSETGWALHVKPTTTFNPKKVQSPSDLLKAGDVVHVRVKEFAKKDQPLVVSLDQEPLVQGALLCLDLKTGQVKALVGGRDFAESQFNRVVHSRRQPGSVFKPIIYAAALTKDFTPSTVLLDSPVEYPGHDDGAYWAPKNYDKDFLGPITFRNALAHSRNVATIKILDDIGVAYARKFIKRMGIESPIKRDLSVALGTSGVSMFELTTAFAVFANKGERVKPIFIDKIVTMKGEVLEENSPMIDVEEEGENGQEEIKDEEPSGSAPPEPRRSDLKEQIISPQQAFVMTHLLQGVVQHGTGQKAKVLGRPIAGKTGTTSDYADAWFIGYTPSLLTSVWVGFDDKTSLGEKETGARAALPVWISFMEEAVRETPIEYFPVPPGVTMMKVDLRTGFPNPNGSQETVMEAFVDGTLPPQGQTYEEKETPRESTPLSILSGPRLDSP